MPLFSKVFRSKDASKKANGLNANANATAKPQWVDSWLRTRVDPEEVVELLHGCTKELKSRALDVPFLLLPFRPSSDPSAAKTFVRNYFIPPKDRPKLKGSALQNELRMAEVMVLISVMKWCWARLPGGVVSWDTYKMFKVGEKDSRYAMDSFRTFLPISVESDARVQIITDFFDLLAALAAHAKNNGLGGYKLSRYAGWWAFEQYDTGKGFEAGYKAWDSAATATCHMFFAYLRSSSPEPGKTNGILDLPRSLQHLVATTTYPPASSLITNDTTKVVMVVDVVSPTPYALLRRAKSFQYRDDDFALQRFAAYNDPVEALTEECKRVLRAISTTNQSHVSDAKTSTSLVDPSWSRFEDIGFSTALDDIGETENGSIFSSSALSNQAKSSPSRSPVTDLNRPTTPSWADFLSSGFVDENGNKTSSTMLLPPDKMLPPISSELRGQSSQSHRRNLDTSSSLEPGELASITKINLDDSFWWVWISSLACQEPTSRKACFGRCALIETSIRGGRWMVMEEQVKGAAPEPIEGAYIAEKKGFLSFTTVKGKLTRRRSGVKKSPLSPGLDKSEFDSRNSTTLAPDQQARIRKAAQDLANKNKAGPDMKLGHNRRGRFEDQESRTNSIFTLGIKDEASPALQWAKQYDKNAIRAQYLGNQLAGKGSSDYLTLPTNGLTAKRSASTLSDSAKDKDLPSVPKEEIAATKLESTLISSATTATPTTKPTRATEPTPERVQDVDATPTVIEPTPLPVQPRAPMTTEPSAEAAVVALPPPTPEPESIEALPELKPLPRPSESQSDMNSTTSKPLHPSTHNRKVSRESTGRLSPEQARKTSPEHTRRKSIQNDPSGSQRPNGIKRLFGSVRKSRDETAAPRPVPEANPAVAAARRALETKMNPPEVATGAPNNFGKYKSVRAPNTSGSAAPQADRAKSPASDHPVQALPQPSAPIPVSAPAPVSAPVPTPIPAPASEEFVTPAASLQESANPFDDQGHQPPRTRRDEEFDKLSRVDTRERQQADEEFARFDQGPLLEQPSALPEDYPAGNELDDDATFRSKHHSVYSAVTMHTEDTEDDEDDEQPELSEEVSANDRWAQIRRNAAERAGRFSDDHGTRSRTETRTDDGETSGEETIESRVARIKARVAELTGNMEGVRK